jgi:glutamate 5-kinase
LNTIPTDIQTLVVKIGTTMLSGERPFDGQLLEPVVQDLARIKRERKLNVLVV